MLRTCLGSLAANNGDFLFHQSLSQLSGDSIVAINSLFFLLFMDSGRALVPHVSIVVALSLPPSFGMPFSLLSFPVDFTYVSRQGNAHDVRVRMVPRQNQLEKSIFFPSQFRKLHVVRVLERTPHTHPAAPPHEVNRVRFFIVMSLSSTVKEVLRSANFWTSAGRR